MAAPPPPPVPTETPAGFDTAGWLNHALRKRRAQYVHLADISVLLATWNVAGSVSPSVPWDAMLNGTAGPSLGRDLFARPLPPVPPGPPIEKKEKEAMIGNDDDQEWMSSPRDRSTSVPLLGNSTVSPLGSVPILSSTSSVSVPGSPTMRTLAPPPLPPRDPIVPTADVIAVAMQEAETSTGSYLAHDPATLAIARARFASALNSGTEPGQYSVIAAHQLVGMVLLVAVHERVRHAVANVEVGEVGCGILGMLGNKGAVAVRFTLHASRICIVNAHLAADADMWARRNADFHEIRRRLWFRPAPPILATLPAFLSTAGQNEAAPIAPEDASFDEQGSIVFWMGDLNYRLPGTQAGVAAAAIRGEFDGLLAGDQLRMTMAKSDAFAGYAESAIGFPPTYKYDIGSMRFDTSEKRRTPAYCDRILYRSPPAGPEPTPVGERYMWHPAYVHSDHKPVSLLASARVAVIDPDKLATVTRDVLRDHDKWENEQVPEATVTMGPKRDAQIVSVGAITLGGEAVGECTLENTGKIPFAWELVARPGPVPTISEPWCNVEPQRGLLEPGETQVITFSVILDTDHAARLNAEPPGSPGAIVSDIVVLRLKGGRDFFLAVEGTWTRTCLLRTLESLCGVTSPSPSSPEEGAPKSPRPTVPRELESLLHALREYAVNAPGALDVANIADSSTSGGAGAVVDESAVARILADLDTGSRPLSVTTTDGARALVRALAVFLELLVDPLVPEDAQPRFVGNTDPRLALETIAELDPIHRACLLMVLETCVLLVDAHVAARPFAEPALERPRVVAALARALGPAAMRLGATGAAGAATPPVAAVLSAATSPSVGGGSLRRPVPVAVPSSSVRAKIDARVRAFAVLIEGVMGQ
ncbi:Endonuclease/exonuclease/phosphatase [Blastocladiella britannica]|nr:Endonuclease/exonuclease/phosphatase [Blastocladiella britannica]